LYLLAFYLCACLSVIDYSIITQVLTGTIGAKTCEDAKDALDPATLHVLPYIWQMRLADQIGVPAPKVPEYRSPKWNETHGRIAPDFRKHAAERGLDEDIINV